MAAGFLRPLLAAPRANILRNVRTGRILASSLDAAFDSRKRRQGLLGRAGLEPDTALILAPCSGVHTCFMRFAIDVVFVRSDGVVLRISRHLKPWRLAVAWRAFAVIELTAGGAADLQPGDAVRLERI